MKDPIFVVGIPRCGSTLWAKILEKSDELARIREMRFLDPWQTDFKDIVSEIGNLHDDKNVEKLIKFLFEKGETIQVGFWDDLKEIKNASFKEKIHNEILKSDRSLKSIFEILIEEFTRYKGHNRFFVKFPVSVNNIKYLFDWYPDAKILHIIRDPRAVAMSKTGDPGGTQKLKKKYPQLKLLIEKSMIYFVAVQYIWNSKIHNKYKAKKNYTLFKYEDLLYDPEETIRKLCDVCEIEFKQDMLFPRGGQPSSITNKNMNGFDKEAAIRWKKKISDLDKNLITALTKRSMKRFGYNPDNHLLLKDQNIKKPL